MENQVNEKISLKTVIITSIVTLLFGLVQAIFPSYVISIVGLLAGAGLLIIGLANIFLYIKNTKNTSNGLAKGILLVIAGLYFIFKDTAALEILSLLLGIFIILNGVMGFQFSFDAKRLEADKWKISMIFALINIVLGLVILFFPFSTVEVLIIYNGIFMTISAILNLLSLIFNKSKQAGESEAL